MDSMRKDKPFIIKSKKELIEKYEKWADMLKHLICYDLMEEIWEEKYEKQLFVFRTRKKEIKGGRNWLEFKEYSQGEKHSKKWKKAWKEFIVKENSNHSAKISFSKARYLGANRDKDTPRNKRRWKEITVKESSNRNAKLSFSRAMSLGAEGL